MTQSMESESIKTTKRPNKQASKQTDNSKMQKGIKCNANGSLDPRAANSIAAPFCPSNWNLHGNQGRSYTEHGDHSDSFQRVATVESTSVYTGSHVHHIPQYLQHSLGRKCTRSGQSRRYSSTSSCVQLTLRQRQRRRQCAELVVDP